MKQSRKKIRGGRYVGEGAYGCTFTDPPLKCTTNSTRRNKNQLSKLMDPIFAEEEHRQSNLFRQIDPAEQYFITVNHSCTLNTTNIKPSNQMDKCTTIKSIRSPKSLLFYKFGGHDLSQLEPLMPELFSPLFTSFINLFDGLQVAHENHIIHHDIKAQNIVVGSSSDGMSLHTRFIDFGFAHQFPIADRNEMGILIEQLKDTYIYWPFDVRIFNPKTLHELEYIRWHDEYKKYYPDCSPLFFGKDGQPRVKFDDYMIGIVSKFSSKTSYSFENVLLAADRYALGLVCIDLLRFLQYQIVWNSSGTDTYFIIRIDKKRPGKFGYALTLEQYGFSKEIADWHREVVTHIATPIYQIINGLCKYDPMDRMTLKMAKQIYKTFVFPHIDRLLEPSLVYNGINSVKTIKGFQLQPLSPGVPQPPVTTGAVPVIAPPSVSPKSSSRPPLPKSRRRNNRKKL